MTWLRPASSLYSAAVTWRRQWYTSHPSRQRRLSQPVISVGNLRAGGSGKTPIVESLARLLAAQGERPAILTRGHARRAAADGVTVVSDGDAILVDVERAGDEPLMLARHLPRVPVLVGRDRYLSGLLAERRFRTTVHILDDGFQHLALARDIDLLVVDTQDLADDVLPAGRLREPVTAASMADALLISGSQEVQNLVRDFNVARAFRVDRRLQSVRWIVSGNEAGVAGREAVVAFAAVARPERFFEDLASAHWRVVATLTFPDHHWFNNGDLESIARRAREAGAKALLTTEKDAARLESCDLSRLQLPVGAIPLTAIIEPADAFRTWLFERLGTHPARRTSHPAPHVAPRSPHSALQ